MKFPSYLKKKKIDGDIDAVEYIPIFYEKSFKFLKIHCFTSITTYKF